MPSAGERQSAAAVLAQAKARTARVRLVLDGELLDEHEQLEQELAETPEGTAEARALAEQLAELEERIKAAEVEFVFRGIGRGRWRKLMADFPPPDDQKVLGAEFEANAFSLAAVAASLVDPVMTVEDLEQLGETLGEVAFYALWDGCLKANMGAATRPESLAARAILANGRPRLQPLSSSGSAEAS